MSDFDKSGLYFMRAIMGAPGMGKSSLVDQYMQEAKANGRQIKILDPSAQFPGLGEWPGEELADSWLRSVKDEGFHGLLILDDADLWLGSNAPKGSAARDLFVSFRHWGVDVVINSRRSQDVPKVIFANADSVALFNLRGYHAREAIRREYGPEVLADVPQEPHRYLLVNADGHERQLFATRQRETKVAADTKQ